LVRVVAVFAGVVLLRASSNWKLPKIERGDPHASVAAVECGLDSTVAYIVRAEQRRIEAGEAEARQGIDCEHQ
jgi:hypothetical protein